MFTAIVRIYGNHIIKGTKLFEEVPENIKDDVKEYVLSLDPTFFAGNDENTPKDLDGIESDDTNNSDNADSDSTQNTENNSPSSDTGEANNSTNDNSELTEDDTESNAESGNNDSEDISTVAPSEDTPVNADSTEEPESTESEVNKADDETTDNESDNQADSDDSSTGDSSASETIDDVIDETTDNTVTDSDAEESNEEANETTVDNNHSENIATDDTVNADTDNETNNEALDTSDTENLDNQNVTNTEEPAENGETETKPFSFNEAYSAANDGDTITLLDDVNVARAISINKPITINLNGKAICSEKSCLSITADLTINGDGNIAAGSGGSYTAITAKSGNVIINGGIYSVGADENNEGNSCIYVNGDANVTINGGQFSTDAAYRDKYYVLNKKNGCKGNITVTGGKFVNYDPSNGDDVDEGTFLADGYTSVNDNNVYTVSKAE